MKLISWNVNGLRACLGKGFLDFVLEQNAELVAVQETKMQPEQAEFELPGYRRFWNSAERRGYSGTLILSRLEPLSVQNGLGIEAHDHEGRVITLEFEDFYFVNVYTPNSQQELARLEYRMQWDADFRVWLQALDARKPVILCGDLNVAHREIDLKNPGPNQGSAGFTPQERSGMTALLDAGFCDSFRLLYPDRAGAYSWWSYRFGARKNNAGWRIDYFLVSQRLAPHVADSLIDSEILGSDHCPVTLLLR